MAVLVIVFAIAFMKLGLGLFAATGTTSAGCFAVEEQTPDDSGGFLTNLWNGYAGFINKMFKITNPSLMVFVPLALLIGLFFILGKVMGGKG